MSEYKRFLWVAMMVTGTCVAVVVLLSLKKAINVMPLIAIPTIFFIPVAIIVAKYKLYLPRSKKNNLSAFLTIMAFALGLLVATKLGSNIKGFITVFGFEISTLLYFLVRRADKMSR